MTPLNHAGAPAPLSTFNFGRDDRQYPLRTVQAPGGQLWFVAQDVCRALDLTNTARALSRLDDDEKDVTSMNTLRGGQKLSIISEAGLYALILRSRKVEAKAFKRWVIHDVLPAIRGDGLYVRGEERLLSAATPEELKERIRDIEAIAARGIEAKIIRGMDGQEEKVARSDSLRFLARGRKRSNRLRGPRFDRGDV
jgi:anti-repressor protein